ncbi:outer membrane protein/peptidoglycan-associated (lipo)protein [Belliella baltica DSM 15883]|uniref:Outer membrane protein/peptidoglycan-associated (Lipo)protein n=1 Tax=Belliella baltica (strain DSM 15883 / CIP 108006 / LMG 21964 / BA134) TaxID=866536 RepID=I3Z0I3_BELBD|nr:OmpA family protein [Belliella baltica]AFL82751.1 outer membrane protein/peptidoglycan-associated (lipo)protein [Belliella baltica DSM 15883]
MKKLILIILASFLSIPFLFAQQKEYDWRLGVSGGYSNYYGDLTPYRIRGFSNFDAIHHLLYFNENYFDQYSFKISLERKLSPTVGLQFSYGQYQFSMSDRYIRRNGELLTSGRNFDRALNFQNNTRDMGVSFVFKADNDKLLSSKSLLAPYFTLGFGLLDFDISGDLLDDNGNRYDYTNPTTVGNGSYETELPPLRTELSDGYDLWAFYANLGLGIRLRLGQRLEIFAQSDFIHSFTGYLDDVDGTYRESYDNDFQAYAAKPGPNTIDPATRNRGENSGNNDWVIYHGVGLKFNFGASKKSFQAPTLSTYYPDYGTKAIEEKTLPEEKTASESDSMEVAKVGDTYNYYTNIQLVDQLRLDSLSYRTQILTWEQQIADRRERILQSRIDERNYLDIQNQVNDQFENLKTDTVLVKAKKDSLLSVTESSLSKIKSSLDSIQNRKTQFETEIDSISKLRNDYKIQPRTDNTSLDSLISPTNISRSMASISRITSEGDIVIETNAASRIDSVGKEIPMERLIKEGAVEGRIMERKVDSTQKTNPIWEQDNLNKIKEQEDRISRLETESRRLQSERDSLSRLPREVIYMRSRSMAPSLPDRSKGTKASEGNGSVEKETIIREKVIETEIKEVNPEKDRNLFRSIGAFFGGAAVSRSIQPDLPKETTTIELDTVRTSLEEPIIAPDSLTSIDSLANLRLEESIVNEDSLKMRISNQSRELERRSQQELSEKIAKIDSLPREILRDTVFLESDPLVRLLRYKEIIYFDINQRVPAEEELKKLANLVDFIKENEDYQLTLTGYADNTGNINYNLKLAEERTKAISEALIQQFGISEDNITLESGGQVIRGFQRSSNDQDRKVEVRIERKN